jgi:flavin-dependent dehydrogenase
MNDHDVIIVGGSVAGAALALHLGRRGVRTLVLEKARFPRRKACGEGLMPHGVRALADLGLAPPGLPVRGIRYHAPSGDTAEGLFDAAGLGPGLMVRRDVFDDWLLAQARATPHVDVRQHDVRHVDFRHDRIAIDGIRASVVAGADGTRSLFHRLEPFRRTHPRRERLGLSMRIRGADATDLVDIHIGDRGEAYLGPAGGGEASLAVLLERGTSLESFLDSVPRLRDVDFTEPVIGASPLGSRVTPIVHGRALLIGDAAGTADPIAGEGMSLALLSAVAAADAIEQALATGDLARLSVYERERRRLARPSERIAALLLQLCGSRWLADRAVRRLARRPTTFSRLLRAACGLETMSLLEPARLLL